MKLSKSIISAAICVSLALGLTACEEEAPNSVNSSSSSGITTPSTTTTTNTLDDDIANPVDIGEFVDETKTLENPNLVYFSHYDARVAGDIKPGVKLFEETYGGKIDYIQVAWDARIERLQTLIASGDSPDLVDKDDLTYPSLISKNVYEDLTNYIDLTAPQWDGLQDLISSYEWKGKLYYYPFTINALPTCLIYNKTTLDKYSLDDPKEMYDKNEWTWDSFAKIMRDFVEANPDAVGGVYGLLGTNIIITTGTPLFGTEDGMIVNNINNKNVERAALYLEGLRREKLAVRGDGMWSNETAPLTQGNVAFLGVGQYKITDYSVLTLKTGTEYGFVPYPRDPEADKYYYGTQNFGYMVPKGSKNVEGAAAFIDIMRQCNTDPELLAIQKESIMKDKHYSEETYEFLSSFNNIENFDMVADIYGGFGSEFTTLIDDILINLAFEQGENQKSWTQLRDSYEGVINNYLSEFTK